MERQNEKELTKLQYVWPKAAVLQLIQLWRDNPCLYNPKHELYHNKRGRHNALVEMADTLNHYYPDITPNEVKNKITYLRGQYTREISRIKEKNTGDGKDAYVPSVFWYSDMEFLEEFIHKRKSTSKLYDQKSEQVEDSCASSQQLECDESPTQTCKRSRLSSDTPVSSRSMSQENPLLLTRNPAPQSFYNNAKKNINEKDEAFCNYIKMELNEITNKNIKDELIEKITLAVFDAKKEQRFYNNDLEKSFADF